MQATLLERLGVSSAHQRLEVLRGATPAQARQAILSIIRPLQTQTIALDLGLGRTLSGDVFAHRDQPPFDASAMDGYAVRSSDTPAVLTQIGQSVAGAGFAAPMERGQCVRIFTGAPIPEGADGVVVQEDALSDRTSITVPFCPPRQHMRSKGIDFKAGTKLLSKGDWLDPIALALAAATGASELPVFAKPRVSIMSGGDEIVAPGGIVGPFDVYDSITTGLAALLTTWGAEVTTSSPKRDTLDALQSGFNEAFANADLVVTIGGASVGDRDLMKPALAMFDPHMIVDKIAVRPGKPIWFATTRQAPVLGLPGNPASALVCAYLFLKPILAAMQGRSGNDEVRYARLLRALPANGPREHYVRARTCFDRSGQVTISPCEDQDSSLLSVFHSADALIQCAPLQSASAVGDTVAFIPLYRELNVG